MQGSCARRLCKTVTCIITTYNTTHHRSLFSHLCGLAEEVATDAGTNEINLLLGNDGVTDLKDEEEGGRKCVGRKTLHVRIHTVGRLNHTHPYTPTHTSHIYTTHLHSACCIRCTTHLLPSLRSLFSVLTLKTNAARLNAAGRPMAMTRR